MATSPPSDTSPMPNQGASLLELIGDRSSFPILAQRIFLDHAATAPINAFALRAQLEFLERSASTPPSWPSVSHDVARVRGVCANSIGASEDEIAFVKNTSEGISTAAYGRRWVAGERIVVAAAEYPSNMAPWVDVRNRFGVDLVVVPETTDAKGVRRVSLDQLINAANHSRTALVTVSYVEYASGQRLDLRSIGQLCRKKGSLFCVDAIQGLGVLPLNVDEMCIDILAADSHKWLLSSAGSGILYIRRTVQPHIRPLSLGWMNTTESGDSTDIQLADGSLRYESGSLNVGGLLGLEASMTLIHQVGIQAISERVHYLTNRLEAELHRRSYVVASPRGAKEWSGILSFSSQRHQSRFIASHLRLRGIDVAVRQGLVRVSPHFYNTDEQIDELAQALPP